MSKDMLGKKQLYEFFEKFIQSPEVLKGKQFKYIPPEILSELQENFGFSIVNSSYYSPMPSVGDINSFFDSIGDAPIYFDKNIFNKQRIGCFFDKIFHYIDEISFNGRIKSRRNCYYFENTYFSHSDAAAYYSIIRHFEPEKIVEIGSGYSTKIAKYAVNANKTPCKITCIEPYPENYLLEIDEIEIIKKKAQDISSDWLNSVLRDGDILFIDSTHTVKEGGDVIHLICKILPEIKKNILVHFHDIFLPLSFPKEWLMMQLYWTEQYLLYAFLLNNQNAQVLYGSTVNNIMYPERMKKFTVSGLPGGGSIWFELLNSDPQKTISGT